MEVKVTRDNINVNNQASCEIVITNDKKNKEELKKAYSDKILEVEKSGSNCIYFLAKKIPNDKNTIKVTTEAIMETLFDISWYFHDNNINDFNIIIVSEDENTEEIYIKACKKWGC